MIRILTTGLCVPEACDVRIELIPCMDWHTVILKENLAMKSLDVVDATSVDKAVEKSA